MTAEKLAVLINDATSTARAVGAAFVEGAFPTGKVAVKLYHFEKQTPAYQAWIEAKRESKARWFGLA